MLCIKNTQNPFNRNYKNAFNQIVSNYFLIEKYGRKYENNNDVIK